MEKICGSRERKMEIADQTNKLKEKLENELNDLKTKYANQALSILTRAEREELFDLLGLDLSKVSSSMSEEFLLDDLSSSKKIGD